MRIALLAHVRQPIAPPFRGGMEAHSWHLAEGLRARGHDVVLFASGDSDGRFAIDPVLPEHQEKSFPGEEHTGNPALIAHLDAGYAAACDRIAAGGFDVLHNNSLSRLPLEQRRTRAVPTVTSLHVPPYDALRWFVQNSISPAHRITATSHGQMHAWFPQGSPPEVSVLHNGVDPSAWPYRDHGDGSAVWCGRITPFKGTHLAIRAARRAGIALTLFGSTEDTAYWEGVVLPLLGGAIRYGGHLDGPSLAREIGKASVFLFTPCWDEPFGLVAIEAMACGLPVASIDRGAAREVIGEAGAFAPSGDEDALEVALAGAIAEALAIPRRIAHARVRQNFTQNLWLDRCERLYAEARNA
ncbi:glycosyl transferase family 1 [Methylobacterium sp. Leaf469]|uniref:glycosyltransferase n=1 Tax=Methylobacterium sp. Leaf469 TaxID=1736387 RepID=UPI0006F1C872|nr:glycosyltransferase [Methylobacterium sp. Leaf469]KQT87006.1 glycosyl transferase family 1 [Methylobacterium sp. Leaf469]